jgi:hypothetical protein
MIIFLEKERSSVEGVMLISFRQKISLTQVVDGQVLMEASPRH